MRWGKVFSAGGLLLFEVSAGMVLPDNITLAALLGTGGLICGCMAVFLHYKDPARKAGVVAAGPQERLTDLQRKKLRATLMGMQWSGQHEHRLDTVGIVEDMEHERPLHGPCRVCGKPSRPTS